MHCNAVYYNCLKMIDHINSHFTDDGDVEMTELPLPEFISTGVIKLEPKTETVIPPTAIAVRKDLLLTDIKTEESTVVEGDRVNRTNSLPPVIKIVKLKPVKLRRPVTDNGAVRKLTVGEVSKIKRQLLTANIPKSSLNSTVVKIVKLKPTANKVGGQITLVKPPPSETSTVKIVKLKPTANKVGGQITSVKPLPSGSSTVKIVKLKPTTNASNKSNKVDGQKTSVKPPLSESSPVKIVKLKISPMVNPKNCLLQPSVTITMAKPFNGSELKRLPEPAVESPAKISEAELQLKKVFYAREINRYGCYQCEMEERIHNPTDPRRHFCHLCKARLPNHADFEQHIQNVHNKDINKLHCNGYYCYVCEKMCQTRLSLVTHIRIVHQHTDHLCAECGSIFKSYSRLKSHMKQQHENQTYECDHCGKIFRNYDRLRQHMGCHNTSLSFVCNICSKAFKLQRYLRRHMAVHNDTKITCRHCDATFNFSSVRRAHEISRHNAV